MRASTGGTKPDGVCLESDPDQQTPRNNPQVQMTAIDGDSLSNRVQNCVVVGASQPSAGSNEVAKSRASRVKIGPILLHVVLGILWKPIQVTKDPDCCVADREELGDCKTT